MKRAFWSRLITAAATLALLTTSAGAQIPWKPAETVVVWRHTGSNLPQKKFSGAGAQITTFCDSMYICHANQSDGTASGARKDTSLTYTFGQLGQLEDWAPSYRPPTTTAGGAGDSVWVFDLMYEAAPQGQISGLTNAFGDSVSFAIDITMDGGASWQLAFTASLTDLSGAGTVGTWSFHNQLWGTTYPITTLSRLNFWVHTGASFRIRTISADADWNGCVEMRLRYPKVYNATKGI